MMPNRQILPCEIAETGADLEVVVEQQPAAHFLLVHARQHAHRVHLRQAIRFFDQVLHPKRLQAGLQRRVIALVARPRILEALLAQHQQGFVQRVAAHWSARCGDRCDWRHPSSPASRFTSMNQLCTLSLRPFTISITRSLKLTGDRPGVQDRHFWLAE